MKNKTDSTEIDENGYYSEEAATFGDRLADARETLGLSQEEFAKRVGIKLKTLVAWENDFSEPRANKLQMIAGMLNVSMVWLMTGEGTGIDMLSDTVLDNTADKDGALMELRAIRSEQSRLSERLARLEKKFRTLLS